MTASIFPLAEQPRLVVAPSPFHDDIGCAQEDLVELVLSPTALEGVSRIDLRAKMGEFAGLVHGGGSTFYRGVRDAVALYRGLNRPLNFEDADDGVFVYISAPKHTFRYLDSCGDLSLLPAPLQSVFVVYASIAKPGVGQLRGKVLWWEWVCANSSGLPEGCDDRYSSKVW